MAKFEYLSIDVEKIITEQMALVPEETLRNEYDRRVKEKQFRVPVAQEAVGTPVPNPNLPPASTSDDKPAAESTVPMPA